MPEVTRISVTLPRDLLLRFDSLIKSLGLRSRSKAVAEAIALYLAERAWLVEEGDFQVIGSLTLIYKHDKALNEMMRVQHAFGGIIRSTSHVHIDDETCLEVLLISGPLSKVREMVKRFEAMRGVEAVRTFATISKV